MSLMLAHRDFSFFFLQPIGICGFKGLYFIIDFLKIFDNLLA